MMWCGGRKGAMKIRCVIHDVVRREEGKGVTSYYHKLTAHKAQPLDSCAVVLDALSA